MALGRKWQQERDNLRLRSQAFCSPFDTLTLPRAVQGLLLSLISYLPTYLAVEMGCRSPPGLRETTRREGAYSRRHEEVSFFFFFFRCQSFIRVYSTGYLFVNRGLATRYFFMPQIVVQRN